jgi:hypothetical protein
MVFRTIKFSIVVRLDVFRHDMRFIGKIDVGRMSENSRSNASVGAQKVVIFGKFMKNGRASSCGKRGLSWYSFYNVSN